MADLDDEKKRRKGLAAGKGRPLPLPDGAVDADDRASVAKVFAEAGGGGGGPSLHGGFRLFGDGSCATFKKT